MAYTPWQLAAIDEYGYNEAPGSPIRQVAEHLASHYSGTVGYQEFSDSCAACGLRAEDFSQSDLTKLNHILERM